jgi:hypothetical protein
MSKLLIAFLFMVGYSCVEDGENNNSESGLSYPVSVSASFDEDSESVTITWDEVEGATGYSIWYAYSESSNFILLADITDTQYIDDSIERETERFYKVKALTEISESIFSLIVSATNDISSNSSSTCRTMWVWDSSAGLDEENRTELIAFCKEKNIEIMYFTTGTNDYSDDAELKINTRNFISDAHYNNIDVHALTGYSAWILPDKQYKYTDAATCIVEYNNSVSENERFDGFQADIEPGSYVSSSLTTEERIQNFYYYVDVHKQAADIFDSLLIDRENFQYGLAISAFYDLQDDELMFEYDGVTQLTLYHIAEIADYFAIMSYRDAAENIISVSENEVDLMESLGKKAWTGVETIDTEANGGDPSSINFAAEGNDYMEEQLDIVEEYYKYNMGYGGVAIHHYTTYSVLQD